MSVMYNTLMKVLIWLCGFMLLITVSIFKYTIHAFITLTALFIVLYFLTKTNLCNAKEVILWLLQCLS